MNFIKRILLFFILLLNVKASDAQTKPLWKNDAFAVYKDSVVQGEFTAAALSDTEIISNYQSPAYQYQSPSITFKFSINGKDNEMIPGVDHHINCLSVYTETPLIQFGKQYTDTGKVAPDQFLLPNSRLLIRLDMREVFRSFKETGYYTTFNGTKIFESDFKGLYVAGATEPLSWDFDNLFQKDQLTLKDPDSDHIYETTIVLNEIKKTKDLASSWKLSQDILAFPTLKTNYTLLNALYNMSVEEMIKAVEPDSTFRTGKEWAGVWTRDISYSIILSMAYLQPKVAKNSLLRKVKNKKIIQDTGTGGAYPISTDRMIWATAAWELYKSTGNRDWLKDAYEIIRNSEEDDLVNAHDPLTGMVKGESSFLDWREQTYPKWMQPADIYESENLGTNALHYQANIVLSEMARLLNKNEDAQKYQLIAGKIKKGIRQHLWMADKGYFGQYLYGSPYKIISPRSEALGEALCVLFDVAEPSEQKLIIENTPQTAFGIPCIYPQIPLIPPYHNNAVWPFVESYWALAAAKVGNETAVKKSMAAIHRAAALFLTNKENFVAENGDYKGTQINSSNMLWSLSGNISLVHKILFGIEYQTHCLAFHPLVPETLKGNMELSNFKYRNSTLNIRVEGFGNQIADFNIDGKTSKTYTIPDTLTGMHTVIIKLSGNRPGDKINVVKNSFSPPAPNTTVRGKQLSIKVADKNNRCKCLRNGKPIPCSVGNAASIDTTRFSVYQAIAIDSNGIESFAGEPVWIIPELKQRKIEIEQYYTAAHYPYKGFSGKGFVEVSNTNNRRIDIPAEISKEGKYLIDISYANGNGPINTENKCAIRSFYVDNRRKGVFVFPQRGNAEWSDWGFSNPIIIYFSKGKHILSLRFDEANNNMNADINQAMVDYIRIIPAEN